ncbi:MAG: reverse transcriptase domain-containing protein, partial [Prevotella sp.]|nr:reverse transcriptase domain-containing protein [Prevotella sp.]
HGQSRQVDFNPKRAGQRLFDSPLNPLVPKGGCAGGRTCACTAEGVPQGGCISPVLSNIYLDKLDKELESRGLSFVRYADDFDIFVKSEMAADRVMASVSSWLGRKLRLKVSAAKTKVARPMKSTFLGLTFWKSSKGWECKPTDKAKAKLEDKVKSILVRKRASPSSTPFSAPKCLPRQK